MSELKQNPKPPLPELVSVLKKPGAQSFARDLIAKALILWGWRRDEVELITEAFEGKQTREEDIF